MKEKRKDGAEFAVWIFKTIFLVFIWAAFWFPSAAFADGPSINYVEHWNNITIHEGDTVTRSDFQSIYNLWRINITWPNSVSYLNSYVGIFRGTFGNVNQTYDSGYALFYEAWDPGTWTLTKELQMPVADIDTPPGDYTFLVAELNGGTSDEVYYWFISGGTSGRAPLRFATLTFHYEARDIVEELPALESMVYAHVPIAKGATINTKDFSGLPYLTYHFGFWPRDVSWWQGFFGIFRGRFGDVERSELFADRWDMQMSAKSFDYAPLYTATSSVYTAAMIERDPKWTGRSLVDYELLWFQTGGNEGVPPKAYSLFEFYLQNDADNVAPLLTATEPIFPEKGYPNKTIYTFRVLYTDANNNPPNFVNVVIGTASSTMKVNKEASLIFHDGDFSNGEEYIATTTLATKVDYDVYFEASDGLSALRFPEGEPLTVEAGYSNVAFLPGLEASRLYRPGEDQVWEPTRNQDIEELYLSPLTGESVNSDIYARGIIDESPRIVNGYNVYKKFEEFMDTEVVGEGIINEWKALPYDWRFDLDEILDGGRVVGSSGGLENISYIEATSTPYIFQELARLAKTSDSGKLTIIAHSNGGLLAKYLLKEIEDETHPYHRLLDKIDKVILVAVPQIGTPAAVEGLLHGDEPQLGANVGPVDWGFIVDEERARELVENMKSAYNLLPSEKYFDFVASPIVEFDENVSDAYDFRNLYGDKIDSFDELQNFLLGDPQAGSRRLEPDSNDEESPNVLKSYFLSGAKLKHDDIDNWTAPENIEVIQIAGWGIKTLRGIEYSCGNFCASLSTLDRDILKTHEGDGTVVLPSAVAMSTSTPNVERYYVNIRNYNKRRIY